MPLKNPEWITGNNYVEWSGDMNMRILRAVGYRITGKLWESLADITAIDTQKSVVTLPLYSYRVAFAYNRAMQNQGVKP